MTQGVYKILNVSSNRVYIGSSCNIEARFQQHKRDLKNNKHYNSYLQNSWNKYGEDCFSFEVIELVQLDSLLTDREQHYIDIFNCSDRRFGYNISQYAERPSDQRHFLKIYNIYMADVLLKSNMTSSARAILLSVLPYIEYKTNKLVYKGISMMNKDICKVSGVSNRVLKYTLNELEGLNIIKRIGKSVARELYVNPLIVTCGDNANGEVMKLFH